MNDQPRRSPLTEPTSDNIRDHLLTLAPLGTVLTPTTDGVAYGFSYDVHGITQDEVKRLVFTAEQFVGLTRYIRLRLVAPPVSSSYDDFSEYE
jgi:hypothetical protein